MGKLYSIFVFLLLGAGSVMAQDRGKIEEIKDAEIDALIARRAELYAQPHEAKGYRVEIYKGPERETYIQMKQKYRTLYPDGQSYLKYTAPDFRLQVGNCANRLEALRLKEQLAKDFPAAAVVEETITLNAGPSE